MSAMRKFYAPGGASSLENVLPELEKHILPVDMDHVRDAYNMIKGGMEDSDRYWIAVRLNAITNALKHSGYYNENNAKSAKARELLIKAGAYIQLAMIRN